MNLMRRAIFLTAALARTPMDPSIMLFCLLVLDDGLPALSFR